MWRKFPPAISTWPCLKKDGTIWTWGADEYGKSGENETPVQIKGINDVSAGNIRTSALKKDGTVWSWGLHVDAGYREPPAQMLSGSPLYSKYFNVNETYLSLRIGHTKAIQGGIKTTIDNTGTKPFIIDSRTVVPIRFVSEKMGAKVTYKDDKTPIKIVLGNITAKVTLGSKKMEVSNNGKNFTVILDVPAQKKTGKTYIPLRAVGQSLGFGVYYDSKTRIIIVSNPKGNVAVRNERLNEAKKYIQ